MKYDRKFYPERGFLFNIAYKDEDFREKLSKAIIKNRTEPYSDELFTSWIARNATLNFLQAPSFVNYYFPEYKNKLFNRDIDILADKEITANFAKRMLLDKNDVFNTSLQSYIGFLSENIFKTTRNNFITPVKIRGSYPHIKGLKYCPYCLKEQEYFKKEWRLSFYSACIKHKCFLVNECPQCKEPILLTKRKLDIESFNCWNCGFVYKNAETEKIHPKSISVEILKQAIDILHKGYFVFDSQIYYSISYFKIVKHLAKLIYLHGYRNNFILSQEEQYIDQRLQDSKFIGRKFLEETITLKESLVLFTAVFNILSSEKKLKEFIESNNIPFSCLIKDLKNNDIIPYFYEKIIWKYYKRYYMPPYSEVKSAIAWMKKQNLPVNWTSIIKLFGLYMDKRQRPDLIELITKN